MNPQISAGLVIPLAIVIFLASSPSTKGEDLDIGLVLASIEHSPASIELEAVLSIHNMDQRLTAQEVFYDVWLGGGRRTKQRVSIAPGTAHIVRIRIPRDSDIATLFVSYRIGSKRNTFFRTVKFTGLSASRHSAENIQVPAALFGVAGVVLGALLTGYLTTKRDRERARQDWSKQLFQEDRANYELFMRSWSGMPSVVLLRESFNLLDQHAWVPAVIRSMYESTVSILEAPSISEAEKKSACKELLLIFEKYRLEPWAVHLEKESNAVRRE